MKSITELNALRESLKDYMKIRMPEKNVPVTPVNRTRPGVQKHILVCGGTACVASNSVKLQEAFQKALEDNGLSAAVKLIQTGCHGFCENGPIVTIYPENTFYVHVKAGDAKDIVEQHIMKGEVVESLLYMDPVTETRVETNDEVPFYKKQVRRVLARCGLVDPENINEYIAMDGYQGLAKALTMEPQAVIDEVVASGLRGRGGAGFPTGKKWQFCRNAPGDKKYIICNADEGDPGAFMDRSVLEGDPHSVLEGMCIGGYAIGADEAYIYCRAEYPLAIHRLEVAIKQAEEIGLLGNNILGSGFNFKIHIKKGAGAFVCGEETALIASIEGRRGTPSPRPPFPANSGLWGKPTNNNNVETWANVASIIRNGASWFNSIGTKTSPGTKVFALTGKINNTGLAEVPMGITMREIIFEIGGGIPHGKAFKAVQIGGPSGGCLPEAMLDTPVDFDSLSGIGAMMGSGGLVVMDETTCMVDVAKFFVTFTQAESCGKCAPCREGTKRMLEILVRITKGQGTRRDFDLLQDLANNIKLSALCGLGQTAPNPVLSTIHYFGDEYKAHIENKECPAGVCADLLHYVISDECKGCGLCARNCPVHAISGQPKEKHVIDPQRCIKCGVCMSKCPFKAVKKA
ncbi:NADH-quinone oxidoreductase subunit NuoF [Megasphaera butyrica]|uniref:NADH-quinone oxidoreductase subunit NuoF n=1 Tax=Megasphaera butyrica TaxID=2981791 RepID=UPI000822D41E|nr:NADH-quinone oxidoreductase subunit NuoF [Megasphaera butyrica]SCH89929.1 NADH-quinone oxidoreductase subunit 1 [uncultured Megasphaera sp.]SCJ48957.1 NADH-quinone oxidoreductase subunit 1 [uncultured Ruminococcus sp.]